MEIMEAKNFESDSYKAAQKRVKDIKGFYIHLLVYVLVNLFIITGSSWRNGFFEGFLDPGNYVTAVFWGIGVLAHWASVFGSNLFLGRKWEERKIKEYMDQEKQERKRWE